MSESYPPLPPNFPPTDYIFLPSPSFPTSHPPITSNPDAKPPTETIILFTPGNPGLIGYYEPFLTHLSSLLRHRHGPTHNISILGISHGGFHTGATEFASPVPKVSAWTTVGKEDRRKSGGAAPEASKWGNGPYELAEQIDMKKELMEFLADWFFMERGTRVRFVLLTHSVGGYIALETVRVLLEAGAGGKMGNGQANGKTRQFKLKGETGRVDVQVVGGVLLFPTITHIAESKSGRVATPLLKYIPHLPHFLQLLSSLLTLLPHFLLTTLLTLFTGFSPSNNNHAFTATLNFLKSPGGVEQALHLARDEMKRIKHDVWGEEIWGSKEGAHMGRKWIMYFGQGDHWVADSARDKLIRSRGKRNVSNKELTEEELLQEQEDESWKPEMLICEERLPHGFCIDHGEVMAKKVVGWIGDILVSAEKSYA